MADLAEELARLELVAGWLAALVAQELEDATHRVPPVWGRRRYALAA